MIAHASGRSSVWVGQRCCQRGQVLLLSLLLTLVGAAALLFVFDSGQIISAKTRALTAADTAAYSAASWRARVLNYNAYSNRAIVAQEVAVAQAITLESWANYFESFTESIETLSRIYPPVYTYAKAAAEAAHYSRLATQYAAALEIKLRDAPTIGYKSMLTYSQHIMHYSASDFGLSAIAQEVAGTADNRIKAYVLPIGTKHKNFIKHYKSDAERQRMRRVVERSLDRFTAGPRDANLSLGVPAACVVPGDPPHEATWHYRKRGGTKLAPGLDRWEAADTGSVQASRFSRRKFRCSRLELYPMGWGGAEVPVGRQENDILDNPGGVAINHRALSNAVNEMSDSERPDHQGTGIARVFDLNYDGLSNKRLPTSRVVVLTKLKASRIRLAGELMPEGERLKVKPALPRNEVRAVGVAEVYFQRPPSAPTRQEFASLYNPFWQVRLASATMAEKAAAAHAR